MENASEALKAKIGYAYKNERYLELALTHSSYAHETQERAHHLHCNERLEFLGDSVLSLLTSRYLYRRFPEYPEGKLSRIRSRVVCEEALFGFATEIGLGDCLKLGRGEASSGGARKPAILADAFEAVLASIYLDAGEEGLDRVWDFLMPFIVKAVDAIPPEADADCKSRLQEFLQKNGSSCPDYRVISETGPAHARVFEMEVYLDSNRIGQGSGTTKRQAEQNAAADALKLFGVER